MSVVLFHCCDKILDKSNLRKKVSIFLTVLSIMVDRNVRWLVTFTCSQKAERDECWCSVSFLLFI